MDALWPFKVLYLLHSCCQMLLLRFVVAYFVHIGLDTPSIGYLQAIRPVSSFIGELLISSIVDHLGNFRATVLTFNSLGVAVFLCLPFAEGFLQIALLYGASSMGLSWMGLRDASVLATLARQGRELEFGRIRKFAALGWGLSGLMTGQLEDMLGKFTIFATFVCLESALMVLLLLCPLEMPPPKASAGSEDRGSLLSALRSRDVLLFFANILVYGVCASAVETYLFVYLLRDFPGASDRLLGCTLLFMTLSEMLVFQFADRMLSRGYVPVHAACHWVFALRCVLYAALPAGLPWLVLAIEPLHGVTFAAMWASSVDFGRRRAPAGCGARFQALISGLYFQVAFGLGALAWGTGMDALGCRAAYKLDASIMVCWSLAWGAVVAATGARSSSPLDRSLLGVSS